MIENKFKTVRKFLGMNQNEFSRYLGVSRRTVIRLESQINPHINTQISKRLFDLGINPYYVNYDEPFFRPNIDPVSIFKKIKKY